MSDDNSTHFQFSLGNIELEISGDRDFVEKMYRMIMRDIETSRKLDGATEEAKPQLAPPEFPSDLPFDRHRERPVVWVHRCSTMMHKIYMSSPEEIAKSPLLRVFDADWLSVVFAQDSLIRRVLPTVEDGQTLWAELTPEGRRKIAQAGEEAAD